jgi:hypothetical protein
MVTRRPHHNGQEIRRGGKPRVDRRGQYSRHCGWDHCDRRPSVLIDIGGLSALLAQLPQKICHEHDDGTIESKQPLVMRLISIRYFFPTRITQIRPRTRPDCSETHYSTILIDIIYRCRSRSRAGFIGAMACRCVLRRIGWQSNIADDRWTCARIRRRGPAYVCALCPFQPPYFSDASHGRPRSRLWIPEVWKCSLKLNPIECVW